MTSSQTPVIKDTRFGVLAHKHRAVA